MKKQMKLTQKGFTLIEMLIVMVIISILIIAIMPNASDTLTTANATGCEALSKTIEAQALTHKLQNNSTSFPTLKDIDPEGETKIAKVCPQGSTYNQATGKIEVKNSSSN